jgi:hypothetical protein
MFKQPLLMLSVVAALGSSCAAPEQAAVFIEGALAIQPPDCLVLAGSGLFTSGALLDIGFDAASANPAVFAAQVRNNLPASENSQLLQDDKIRSPNHPAFGRVDNSLINFEASETFFTTDADRDGETALQGPPTFDTPVNENTARITGLGGSVFNDQTQLLEPGVVFVTAVTAQDAAVLQGQPFIQDALANGPTARARIIANVRLLGQTSGDSDVVSLPFSFPVDLCQGCLVPQCAAGETLVPGPDGTCFPGQDFPLVCQ